MNNVSNCNIQNVPYDVLVQVFEQLDVKSICRISAVCKAWHKIISEDRKIWSHLLQQLELNAEVNIGMKEVNEIRNTFIKSVTSLYHSAKQMPINYEKKMLNGSIPYYVISVKNENHWSDEIPKSFNLAFSDYLKLTRVGAKSLEDASAIAHEFVKHPSKKVGRKLVTLNDGNSLKLLDIEQKLQEKFKNK
jgi:hypothetical protein